MMGEFALFMLGALGGATLFGLAQVAVRAVGPGLRMRLHLRASAVSRRNRARRDLHRLRSMDDNREAFLFLRRVDPLVFEDLVLIAYADTGAGVEYTLRKSGDGGIDGEISFRGQRFAMQAKRYSGRIEPDHVRRFSELVTARGDRYAGGVLVHTGRTGPAAWKALESANVQMVSGQRLIALLKGAGPTETWLPLPCAGERSGAREVSGVGGNAG